MTYDELIAALETADGLGRHQCMSIIDRLEEGLNDCIVWSGGADKEGRGRIWVDGKITIAHRAIWAWVVGPIPTGMLLLHHCDNPPCVNPDHLYVGTHADNMRDMTDRSRHWAARNPERARAVGRRMGQSNTWARGEGNPKAKLTERQADSIRRDSRPTRFLAAQYGVHRTTIQRIRRGEAWAALRARADQ